MNITLRAAIRHARQKLGSSPGVVEFHQSMSGGSLVPIGPCHVGDFWEQWRYALGEIDVSPDVLNRGQFVGVVHQDGAFLVEVSR